MMKIITINRFNRKLSILVTIVTFIIFILQVTYTQAANTGYYVGGTGASDDNPGTSSQPFATIQKAATIAVAGDTIKIRTGIYRETITPTNSGTTGNPIIYQADGAAVVTISGTNTADGGWTVHEGQIYKKIITLPVNGYGSKLTDNNTLLANQVFKDKVMMFEARWPDISNLDDLLDRTKFRRIENTESFSPTSLTDNGLPQISGGLADAKIWLNGWFISQTSTIKSQAGNTINYNSTIADPKFRKFYYITGKLGLLNVEKEWHYENNTLYFWQPGGGSPTGVEYKARNWGFDLRGKSNITITGLQFFGCEPMTGDAGSTNTIIDGIKAKYTNHVFLAESSHNYGNARQTGIKLIGANSIIKNSDIQYASSQGVWLGANCKAENNLIRDISYEGNYGSGITPWEKDGGQIITRNSIFRTGRTAIDFGYITRGQHLNMDISYNDIYYFGMINIDMGGIYAWGGVDLTGTRIHHNWVHDTKVANPTEVDGIQTGIYLDQAAGPITMDHNVLWNNGVADFYSEIATDQRNPGGSFLYNNVFASTTRHSYVTYITTPSDIQRNNIYRKDIVLNWGASVGDVKNALLEGVNPKFSYKDHGGLRYRLKSDSPAIDAGIAIPGITDGSIGVPDIGAYEYGGVDWVAGCSIAGYVPDYYALEEPQPEEPVIPSAPGTITIDDSETGTAENQYEFVGTWGTSTPEEAYNKTDHYSNTTDSYFQIKFSGTQVKVYGEKNSSFGIVAISIDGGAETLVDCYSASRVVNTQLYTSNDLSNGSHTLKVRITGTKNESSGGTWHTADRVVIVTGILTIDDSVTGPGDDRYQYFGTWGTSTPIDAYNKTDHYSNTTDSYYQVKFSGTQVKVYGEMNSSFGIIAISIDGGPETLVDCYTASRTVNTLLYTSPELSNGSHTVKVRITGTKNESSTGTWQTADRVEIKLASELETTMIDDSVTGTGENQYEFVGTWGNSTPEEAYMKTDHYSNTTDNYYQVKFTGTQVKVYGEMNNSFGIVAISIDGGPETLVDCFSATRVVNTLLYKSPVLSDGNHTVKVRITGTKNASSTGTWHTADRIEIIPLASVTTTIDDSVTGTGVNQYEFVGAWGNSTPSEAYNKTDHYSNTTDNYYQVKFTGTQVKVYGEKNSSFGIVAISIDGGAETLVDCYNPTRAENSLLYTSPVLTDDSHTVKVRITGTKNASSTHYWHTADRVVIFSSGVTTGIKDFQKHSEFIIFPNPCNGSFSFQSSTDIKTLEIYTISGDKMLTLKNINHERLENVNISEFPSGIYFVRLFDGNNYFSQKLIKAKD